MTNIVVCRVRYRAPAAAPEPCDRWRAAWGFKALHRLLRATLNTGRILNPVGVVEDGHRKSQRDRVLTGSGRAIRSLTTYHTQPVRIFNLFGLVSAARRLFPFGNPRFQFRQEPARRVADPFHCTNSFVAPALHEHLTTGERACPTNYGANPPQDWANGASR